MRLSQHEAVTKFAEKMTHEQMLLMLETIAARVSPPALVDKISLTSTSRRWRLICEAVEVEDKDRRAAQ